MTVDIYALHQRLTSAGSGMQVSHVENCFGHVNPCAFWVEIPWCRGSLKWRLSFSKEMLNCLPDVTTHDEKFQPLWMGSASGDLLAIWRQQDSAERPDTLNAFVQALLAAYVEYVRAQVAGMHCQRIEHHLSAVSDSPELQLDVLRSPVTGEPSVIISLPMPLLYERMMLADRADGATPTKPRLLATFRVHGNMHPDIKLQMAERSGRQTSTLLPQWSSDATLLQYRDAADAMLAESLCPSKQPSSQDVELDRQPSEPQSSPPEHSAWGAPAQSQPLEELNLWPTPGAMALSSTPSTTSSATTGAAPAVLSPPAVQQRAPQSAQPPVAQSPPVATPATPEHSSVTPADLIEALAHAFGPPTEVLPECTRAQYLFAKTEAFLLLLEVDFKRCSFPDEQPDLTVMSARKPHQSRVKHKECPWSPRWSAQEMANRIFNYIKVQEVPPKFFDEKRGQGERSGKDERHDRGPRDEGRRHGRDRH